MRNVSLMALLLACIFLLGGQNKVLAKGPCPLSNSNSAEEITAGLNAMARIAGDYSFRRAPQYNRQSLKLCQEGYGFIQQQNFEIAKTRLEAAVSLTPDFACAHSNLGYCLTKLGQYEIAISHLMQSIQLDPTDPAPYLTLGSAFQQNGQLSHAALVYKTYLKSFPQERDARLVRALSLSLERELQRQQSAIASMGSSPANHDHYLNFSNQAGIVRWMSNHGPIKVFIAPGAKSSGYSPLFEQLLKESFTSWQAQCGVINFAFVPTPETADIECRWTDNANVLSTPGEGGETVMLHRGKSMQHSTITILTVKPETGTVPSAAEMQAVCLHEIGHALGLIGHSPNPDDVMFCTLNSRQQTPALSMRDLSTIRQLYAQ